MGFYFGFCAFFFQSSFCSRSSGTRTRCCDERSTVVETALIEANPSEVAAGMSVVSGAVRTVGAAVPPAVPLKEEQARGSVNPV